MKPAFMVMILAFAVSCFAAHFSVRCPKCGQSSIIEPMSIVETNMPILGGTIKKQTLEMVCPNCHNEFRAHAEKITQDVMALEVRMPEKMLPPPIPLTVREVPWTNVIMTIAPEGYRLRLIHGTNLDLQQIVDIYSTNRTQMSVLIMERKP